MKLYIQKKLRNKKQCRFCYSHATDGYSDCRDCFIMRGGMNFLDYQKQSCNITLRENKYKRASSHRLCRNKTCSGRGRWSDFKKSMDYHGGNLNEDFFIKMKKKNCFYCGYPSNGIDRKNSEGGYYRFNVVPCCSLCNYMKNTYTTDEFLDKMEEVCFKKYGFT